MAGLGFGDVHVVKKNVAAPTSIRGVYHTDAVERRLNPCRYPGTRSGGAVDQAVIGCVHNARAAASSRRNCPGGAERCQSIVFKILVENSTGTSNTRPTD